MPTLTRRLLLGSGAAAVAALPVLDPARAFAGSRTAERLYQRPRFKRRKGKRFRLVDATGSMDARLLRVRDLPSGVAGDAEQFSLTFRSARRLPAGGATYTLQRPGFVPTALFVVPLGESGRLCEAIVNSAPRRRRRRRS
jgi:uncharacterized protein DUF6916